MFSTLSCRSSERAKVVKISNFNLARRNVIRDESTTRFSSRLSTYNNSNNKINHSLVAIIGLMILIASLQCLEAKHLKYESQEGQPCICNQTFYQSCPKADQCEENKAPAKKLPHKPKQSTNNNFVPYDPALDLISVDDHDYGHPDHVIKSHPIDATYDRYDSNNDGRYDRFSQDYQLDDAIADDDGRDFDDGRERVIRHRKVYVAKKGGEPNIHTIKLTIPVKVPEIKPLPDPKPVYKLRKYITYENRPEIKMVPVTKTIIKPAGVGADQIINSDSFDRKDESKFKNKFNHHGYASKK